MAVNDPSVLSHPVSLWGQGRSVLQGGWRGPVEAQRLGATGSVTVGQAHLTTDTHAGGAGGHSGDKTAVLRRGLTFLKLQWSLHYCPPLQGEGTACERQGGEGLLSQSCEQPQGVGTEAGRVKQ